MMSRTQLSLPQELRRRAQRRAQELGISLAEYVRRLLDQDLDVPEPVTDVTVVFDLGRSAGSDIGRDKDRMIGEAFDGRTVR